MTTYCDAVTEALPFSILYRFRGRLPATLAKIFSLGPGALHPPEERPPARHVCPRAVGRLKPLQIIIRIASLNPGRRPTGGHGTVCLATFRLRRHARSRLPLAASPRPAITGERPSRLAGETNCPSGAGFSSARDSQVSSDRRRCAYFAFASRTMRTNFFSFWCKELKSPGLHGARRSTGASALPSSVCS
jgi:hypothetical protein